MSYQTSLHDQLEADIRVTMNNSSPRMTARDGNYLESCVVPKSQYETKDPSHEVISDWLAEQTTEFFNELYLTYSMMENENPAWTTVCGNYKKHIKKAASRSKAKTIDHENLGYPPGVVFRWRKPKPLEAGSETPSETEETQQHRTQLLPPDEYVHEIFLWIEGEMENETIFPTDPNTPFPTNFRIHLSKIYARMFRIYAIILSNECLYSKQGLEQVLISVSQLLYFSWYWIILKPSDIQGIIDCFVGPIWDAYNKDMIRYAKEKKPSRRSEDGMAMEGLVSLARSRARSVRTARSQSSPAVLNESIFKDI